MKKIIRHILLLLVILGMMTTLTSVSLVYPGYVLGVVIGFTFLWLGWNYKDLYEYLFG